MTVLLTHGNRRTAGFSLMELLLVMSVLAIAGLLVFGVIDYRKRQFFRAEISRQRLVELLDDARTNAKAGLLDEGKRAVDLRLFKFAEPQLEFVREIDPAQLPPNTQLIQPDTVITFEPQSGRTENQLEGIIVIRDNLNQMLVGVRIAHPYSPPAQYTKQPGWTKFEIASNGTR